MPDCPCYYNFKYKNAGISREPLLSANTDIVKIERRILKNPIILSSILYRFLALSPASLLISNVLVFASLNYLHHLLHSFFFNPAYERVFFVSLGTALHKYLHHLLISFFSPA